MAEGIPVLEVDHVTCDVLNGEGNGVYAVLHLKQSDGALLPVALPLEELFYVAGHLEGQLKKLAGMAADEPIDRSRPSRPLND